MEIAFDRVKDAANLQKHGVSLADAVHLDWSSLLIATDTRRDYGEDRDKGFGVIGGRLYLVAFTPRDDTMRVISFRKANNRAIHDYEQN
ncbi:BrnT family toxin [Caballeronia sp. SEWSISQ10-4 2]|uniref:BrnT family toxin n=1 Tax=Caballeronia sp. SEWSISQ10-4 2 TaxID=2937438 RepID=UPI00265127AF|nr:BrnT family toxin [Caballeronia sp. SEWSISQ10-4 2]MDN7177702.1 BrnT family toxin [Caballeronia sp. SEWSISQ10-4 2]